MVKRKKHKKFSWNNWYVYDHEKKEFIWIGDIRKLKDKKWRAEHPGVNDSGNM